MTDVFISYKKQDAGRVIRLVEGLRAEGFAVWWDHGIQAGSEWDRSIQDALYAAKVVIAVWSEASIGAPWVKEEATVGKNRGVLLPVKIDAVEPPLGFMMIQAADLVGWNGDRTDPRWAHLLDSVRVVAGQISAPSDSRASPPPAPAARSGLPMAALTIALSAAAIAAATVWFAVRDRAPPPAGPAPTAPVVTTPAIPSPAPVSVGEQQLWDKALSEKTRQGFQSYLVAYPNGAYAQRARDILLTCRTETRESWKPGPAIANQMVRGVGDTGGGMTPIQACAKAKADVHSQAKSMCETIVHNGGYRNARWVVTDRDCDCQRPNDKVTICIADLPSSCLWEMKVAEQVDICGGG